MQIQRVHPKIPKTLLSAPEEYLRQRIRDKYRYPNCRKKKAEDSVSEATERALLKYYPKYCHAVRLGSSPKARSVLSRIKQIKTISHFEYDYEDELSFSQKSYIVKRLKKLLGNKRKSLKSLPVTGLEKEQQEPHHIHHLPIMEMCPFFPQIQTLSIYLLDSHVSYADPMLIPRPLKNEILQSYGFFWDFLKHLKHLEISIDLPNFSVIIPYLQRSKRFLTSLQSFRLTIKPNHKRDHHRIIQSSFQAFLQSPCLLESVTHVYFYPFSPHGQQRWLLFQAPSDRDYWNQIKSIVDRCSNLESVKAYIEEKFSSFWGDFSGSIRSLNNLSQLNLTVFDMKSLIESIEFPLQLRKLTLCLEKLSHHHFFNPLNPNINSQEKTQMIWNGDDDTEEKSQTMSSKLIGKFNNLTLLNDLKLNMELFTYPNDILTLFIIPLLRITPRLQKFEWNFYEGYEKNNSSLDLSVFLESLIALEQLQSFKISQSVHNDLRLIDRHGLLITFSPYKIFSFPNISSVKINARISEDFDFRSFFMAFSEGSQTKLKEISLAKIHVRSIQSFIRLMKILKEAAQFPRLRINLDIVLCVESWGDVERNFLETIVTAKNVFINLKIYLGKSNFLRFAGRY